MSGSFGRQISLNLSLVANQFICRARWAPDSGHVMAVATNAFVKIFDLSKDVISPVYNFKPVTGVIVDFAFFRDKGELHLAVLVDEGVIYIQQLGKKIAKLKLFHVKKLDHIQITIVQLKSMVSFIFRMICNFVSRLRAQAFRYIFQWPLRRCLYRLKALKINLIFILIVFLRSRNDTRSGMHQVRVSLVSSTLF